MTSCGIVFFAISRLIAPAPYAGHTHDAAGGTYIDYAFDKAFITNISEDAVAKSPSWNPNESNPPLSARQALRAADRLRREKLGDDSTWKWGLESIALVPLDAKQNKWCWLVRFAAYPTSGGLGGRAPE